MLEILRIHPVRSPLKNMQEKEKTSSNLALNNNKTKRKLHSVHRWGNARNAICLSLFSLAGIARSRLSLSSFMALSLAPKQRKPVCLAQRMSGTKQNEGKRMRCCFYRRPGRKGKVDGHGAYVRVYATVSLDFYVILN